MVSEELNNGWSLEHFNFGEDRDFVRTQCEEYNRMFLTSQESMTNQVMSIVNDNDSVPFDGQIFNNDEDAYNFYSIFAKNNGFSIRRERVVGNKEQNIYRREFVCHCSGIARSQKVQEIDQQRKRKSSRCNCNAKMWISKKKDEGKNTWVVTHFNNSHNHELLNDKEVRFLPAYRDIHPMDQKRILLLSKAGCSVNLMMRVLELEKGIDPGHLPFMEKDIRNFLQSQKCVGQDKDALEALKFCKTLKDIDSDFKLDDENKLEHLIWAFGDSIRAYEHFGD